MGFVDRIPGLEGDMLSKVITVIGGLTVFLPATRKFLLRPISNWALGPPIAKPTKAAGELEAKREKFITSAWKCLSYTFFVAFGIWAIQPELYWFWDSFNYHMPYPDGRVPDRILAYYALETGYYIFSSVAIFFEPKMKDRNQMIVHHLFTTFLLVSSFVGNTTKFGVPIMLLHDVADPPLEFAKLCNYMGWEMMANISFVTFAGVFAFFRNYVFPRYIIYPILVLTTRYHYTYAIPTVASLVGLWVLHLIWSYMIYQVIERNMLDGKIEDVRDE